MTDGSSAGPRMVGPVEGLLDATTVIGDREFEHVRRLIYEHAGIALSSCKRPLVQARLGRRMRALGIGSLADYLRHLEADMSGEELRQFINALTTNKTDFMREVHHFHHLREQWAPAVRARAASGGRKLRLWSAACSTGEEPYSIAMTVVDALGPGWDIRILASDIDTNVLETAAEGIYTLEQVSPIPREMLARHFLRGTGARAGLVRVRDTLRSLVAFRRVNLLGDVDPPSKRFDVIFCRNVLIYFDRPTQQRVIARLVSALRDNGLLFLGHSESAAGLVDGLRPVGNTIYATR